MNTITWHRLKQTEWYYKLREEFRCVRVELEKKINIKYTNKELGWFIADVWGITKEGQEYIIEIGDCFFLEKRKQYADRYQSVFIHIPKPSSKKTSHI